MGKKLMTLEDLYNFYSAQGKTQTFSCDNDTDSIVVQVGGKLDFAKNDSAIEGLYPVSLQMCFVGDNLNGSRITTKSMKNALPSAKFRPILAYIWKDEDGNDHFSDHRMHQDENGNLVYDEVPVGVISEEATISYDEENDKDYAFSKGYIYEDYSPALEIIQRDGKCDCSVEIQIRELSFDSKDKIMCLDNFFFTGITILGEFENGDTVHPAMPGSSITLADFSVKEEPNDKLIEAINKLTEKINCFEINQNLRKEDNELQNEEIVEIEETVTETPDVDEEVTFDAEGETSETVEETATEEETPVEEDVPTEEEPVEEPTTDDEPIAEEVVATNTDDMKKILHSVEVEGEKKEFSVSLADKQYAIESLINETYGELDGDYYCVDVYDEESTVVMHSWYTGKHFKQTYKCKKDIYSLVGDRVEVFAQYLTQDEITKLDAMKSNYAEVTDKLAKFEAEPEKVEILESKDYELVSDKAEFVELMSKDIHFDMSVEDVKTKADEILLQYAKAGALQFSVNVEDIEVPKKTLVTSTATISRSRYGGLGRKDK